MAILSYAALKSMKRRRNWYLYYNRFSIAYGKEKIRYIADLPEASTRAIRYDPERQLNISETSPSGVIRGRQINFRFPKKT